MPASSEQRWLRVKPIYAQQNSADYDDGNVYVFASVDVDSNYYLYTGSYTELDFDADENIDLVDDQIQADEDHGVYFSDFADSDYEDSEYPPLKSNNPVATGHEYGVSSIGWVCFDDGEGDCNWYQETNAVTASVQVASPSPQITNITPSSAYQGDQGTLTVTGSNFIETSGDQLTLNFSGGNNPFTLTSTPSTCTTTCTAKFSYNLSGYPSGSYTVSVKNSEGTSNTEPFTVIYNPPQNPRADPCAVTSNPQAAYSYIVSTGTAGGSGTMSVSFSGTAFSAVTSNVAYGPYSTPSSIAASIAGLISRNYYRYGLAAKAYGPIIIYSGNTTLGAVSNVTTGPSFTTNVSSTAATEAANVCTNAPPPPLSMYAVAYSAYIPVDHITGPDGCTYNPSNKAQGVPAQLIYRGDGYHNTYRVTQAVSLNFTNSQASGAFNDTGTTENYGFGSPYNGQSASLSSQDDDAVYFNKITGTGTADCFLRNAIGKASTKGWLLSSTVVQTSATVNMTGSGQNPLSVPLGSIDWSLIIDIDAASSTGSVTYTHTCYPAHQVKVANTTIYSYTPHSSDSIYIVKCLTGLNPEVTGTSPTVSIR